jgi:hypothetical protein
VLYFIIGLPVGFIATVIYEQGFRLVSKVRKREPIVRLGKFHLHHSLYGLLFIVCSFFTGSLLLSGIGLGVIFEHTVTEKKFVFIDRS